MNSKHKEICLSKKTYSLSTSQVDDNLVSVILLGQEVPDSMIDRSHPQPVSAIDQWRSSLELAHEIPKILGLARIV